MKRVNWITSYLLGLNALLFSVGNLAAQEGDADSPEKSIAKWIKDGDLERANKEIDALEEGGAPPQKIRSLKMQLFLGMRRGKPEGIDVEKEIKEFIDQTKAAIAENPKQLREIVGVLSAVEPVANRLVSPEFAASIVKDIETLVDTPENEKQGAAFFQVLSGLARSKSNQLQMAGKRAEVVELWSKTIDRMEKFVDANPDDNSVKSAILSSSIPLVSALEDEARADRIKRIQGMATSWLDAKPTADLVSSYGMLINQLASMQSRSAPEDAAKLLEDAMATLEKAVEKDDSLTKSAQSMVANFQRTFKMIEAARKQLALIGKPAPAFDAMEWVNGAALTADDLKGKVVLVDFWAVWCGPCIMTFPELRKWSEEYGEKGLTIVGVTRQYNFEWDEEAKKAKAAANGTTVALEDELSMLKAFMASHELKHRSIVTPKESKMQEEFGVTGIPHVAVIDQEGIVRLIKVGSGPQSAKEIEAKIRELLKIEN